MRSVWIGKRQASRTACLVKAQLRMGEKDHLGDCQILDLSPTGARIKIDPGLELPEMFNLFIPARAETRVCKLRWNRDGQIGVEFLANEHITTTLGLIELAARVVRLEAVLTGGGRTTPVPDAASAPEIPSAALADLAQRIARIEQAAASLQARIDAAPQSDISARLGAIEAQNSEIQQALQSLLPMLMRRAS